MQPLTALTGHERVDCRSLAMHRAIAAKLRARPELVGVAEANLRRWTAGAGRSVGYCEAWRELLRLPVEELAGRMVEESERMTALRQASPFAGVLTPRERWAIYREYAQKR